MTLATLPTYNLYQGIPLNIPNTAWPSPNQAGVAVLANNTSNTLQVSSSDGTKYLYPNMADVFKLGGQQLVISPVASGTQATGVLIGTLTATYYSSDEDLPVGYPLTLTPFPGGSQLVMAPNPVGPLPLGGLGPPLQGLEVALLSGASSLIMNIIAIAGNGRYTVQGVQSGKVYATSTTASSGIITVNLAPNVLDTTLYIYGTISVTAQLVSLYQAPGLLLPTVPNLSTGLLVVGNDGIVLPALTSGHYYVFGVDVALPAADSIQLSDSAGFDFFMFVPNAGNQFTNSPPLNGQVSPGPIQYSAIHVNQAADINVRYALGP